MEKRLILAIALSILVLLVWSALVPKPQPVINKEVTTKEVATITPPSEPISAPAITKEEPSPGSLFNYSQDKFELTFNESLAAVKEVKFRMHQDYVLPLKYGFMLQDPSASFRKESASADAVTFVHQDQNKRIIKRFIFSKSNYDIWLEISFQNLSSNPIKINPSLILGALDFSHKNIQARYQDVTIATKEKSQHLSARKSQEFPEAKFVGLRDRYFCAILEPGQDQYSGFVKKLNPEESEIGLSAREIVLAPGDQIGHKFHLYLGPQDVKILNAIKPDWSMIINFGVFDFISQILLQLLEFLYRLVHNWGLAIVILSFLVYFILFPLSLKQMRSMKEMQALQPHIEELRKTYKDNPQKLNKEIMELYRQHKVNPLGGCLPLLLQMPIFLALYQALMRSVALKGARFLWIKDLSEPDRLFILPKTLPILGNEINILPIVMAIGMFVQQKISMPAAASQQAEQQKMMLVMMPLLFGLIFYHMPSGLVLYWFINSTLMLIYQVRMSRAK